MSKTKLNQLLLRSTAATEEYNKILGELAKRKQIDDARSSKNLSWSMIAGIAAIIGIALMIVQILLSIYQEKPSKGDDAPQVQLPGQGIQQSTKSPTNLSSSSSNSSVIVPTKKSK
jgi:heme/copper-type cytochrome/quinol oxidase subunit 1